MNPKLFNMMPGKIVLLTKNLLSPDLQKPNFNAFPHPPSDHPTEQTARSLTLVAKVVQNLANMAEFGQKESHMTGCNEFLASKKAKMMQFLDGFAVSTETKANTNTHTHTFFFPHSLLIFLSAQNQTAKPVTADKSAAPVSPARPLATIYRYCVNKPDVSVLVLFFKPFFSLRTHILPSFHFLRS